MSEPTIKFRPQRGGLEESMQEVKFASSLDELRAYLKVHFGIDDIEKLRIEPYADDKRIGWHHTHLVSVDGYGVLGYADIPPHDPVRELVYEEAINAFRRRSHE